jgi:hypothetical protein
MFGGLGLCCLDHVWTARTMYRRLRIVVV